MYLFPMLIKKVRSIFNRKPYDIGLVLGGGGTRGFAHLGVLQALKDMNVQIDAISGVSAGAVIGSLIAAGKSPEDLMSALKNRKLFDFTSFQLPKTGLLNLSKLEKFLREELGTIQFDELEIPFWCAVTNLNKGQVEYLHAGSLIDAVLASASIPVLFSPVIINNTYYVDGGLYDNFPVYPIGKKCKKIIGVNISPLEEVDEFNSIIDIALRTFQINDKSTTREHMKACDLVVQPEDLCNYGLLSTNNADQLFEIGYKHGQNLKI